MEKRVQEAHSAKDAHATGQATATNRPRLTLNKDNKRLLIISGVIVLIVALVVSGLLYAFRSQIDPNKYQAVFLTNGQVYFGKLKDYYTDRPYITDVYYIQGQDGAGAENGQSTASENQQLVKLGSELHAPENTMILNKSSILFVENLTEEGKVVQLIKQDQEKQEEEK